MNPVIDTAVVFKGRVFGGNELLLVRQVVSDYGNLSRQELANTVCELLDWRRPNGGLKARECRDLLAELETRGRLVLPAPRVGRPRGSRTAVDRTVAGERGAPLAGTVRDVAPVTLRRVETAADRGLWRELIERYHYLGHRVPFGAHLRYLIEVAQPQAAVVGCVQGSSPAWKMAARDQWIGWSDAGRRAQLQRVLNNSRFLLLPWVQVRNLASHVLAQMARTIAVDWERAYGVRPVLVETLVDAERFTGTCYRAANWIALGRTAGRGRDDRHHARHDLVPKDLFVLPLCHDARAVLCGRR